MRGCVEGGEMSKSRGKREERKTNEGEKSGSEATPEHAVRRSVRGVLRLLTANERSSVSILRNRGRGRNERNVTGSVPPRQDSARRQEAQAPIPPVSSTAAVDVLREDPLGGLEAVRLRDSDGKPDDGEEKVDSDDTGGGLEDPGIVASWTRV
jgi:hypothetical protein